MEFQVGDIVTRPINVFQKTSPIRTGVVTRVYSDGPNYPELYEVVWMTESTKLIEPLFCVGYLPHGLIRSE